VISRARERVAKGHVVVVTIMARRRGRDIFFKNNYLRYDFFLEPALGFLLLLLLLLLLLRGGRGW